jgi:hypothetical protein
MNSPLIGLVRIACTLVLYVARKTREPAISATSRRSTGRSLPGVLDSQTAGPRGAEVKLTGVSARLPRTWRGSQAYGLEGVVAGKPQDLTLAPFNDARTYGVWLLTP